MEFDATVFKIGQKDGGLCSGDSGGGVFSDYSRESQPLVLEGINISAGGVGLDCASDGFILRISSKREWIKDQIGKIANFPQFVEGH